MSTTAQKNSQKESKLEGFEHVDVDTSKVDDDIEQLVEEHVDDPDHGFFGPGTMMWKINREQALLLAGPTAATLQNAHPMVGKGVDEHSSFYEDPVGRFQRTFEIVDKIVFGDVQTAVEASMVVRRIHDKVRGELDEDVARFKKGDTYFANRDDLLLWVHATLIEQSIEAYETYVEDLTDEDKEQYYQESKRFGQLMGISDIGEYPETLDDFYDYYEKTIEEELGVSETVAEVTNALYGQLRILKPVGQLFGAGTMPEGAQEELEDFGLKMNTEKKLMFNIVARTIRALPHEYFPARIRFRKRYRQLAMHKDTN